MKGVKVMRDYQQVLMAYERSRARRAVIRTIVEGVAFTGFIFVMGVIFLVVLP